MAITKYYYDQNSFLNIVYALNIACENHLASLVLKNDLSRIIYSSNDYAFRKRCKDTATGGLELPFLNYKMKSIDPSTNRSLFSHMTNVDGYYVPEIGIKFKVVPITVNYEAILFHSQDADLIYASSKLYQDNSNETVLYPELQYGDFCLPIPAFISQNDYNFDNSGSYNEKAYLEKNYIKTTGIDFSIETMFIYPNEDVSVSEEVVLEFLTVKGILDKNSPKDSESIQTQLDLYFT